MAKATLDPDRGYLDKWQMYRALSGEDIGPCRLPETIISSDPNWYQLPTKYTTVYIKPLNSWGGNGVSVIYRQPEGTYSWKTLQTEYLHLTREQLNQRIEPLFASQLHIVQQGAPLARYHDRPFDVRALWQRDSQHWVFAGALCRVGGQDAIVSNIGTGHGEVQPIQKIFADILPRRKRPAFVLANVRAAGRQITRLLSEYRDFVEVGIDFGISHTGQLWLIEVNTDDALGGPSHDLFKELTDQTIYQQIEQRTYARNLEWVRNLFQELSTSE